MLATLYCVGWTHLYLLGISTQFHSKSLNLTSLLLPGTVYPINSNFSSSLKEFLQLRAASIGREETAMVTRY